MIKALKLRRIKAFILSVPRTGIEPAHPCERQILSLLRLPIPPSGHLNWAANMQHHFIPSKIRVKYFFLK